jgi:hypothetical protein
MATLVDTLVKDFKAKDKIVDFNSDFVNTPDPTLTALPEFGGLRIGRGNEPSAVLYYDNTSEEWKIGTDPDDGGAVQSVVTQDELSQAVTANLNGENGIITSFNASTGVTEVSIDPDGIILQSDNGNEWLVDVTNSGNLRTSLVGSGQTDDTRLNQITITANSGQTDPLILAEDSNFSELFTLNVGGDAEFYEPGKGIILVSPDGNERKRVRLGNDGLLKTETV